MYKYHRDIFLRARAEMQQGDRHKSIHAMKYRQVIQYNLALQGRPESNRQGRSGHKETGTQTTYKMKFQNKSYQRNSPIRRSSGICAEWHSLLEGRLEGREEFPNVPPDPRGEEVNTSNFLWEPACEKTETTNRRGNTTQTGTDKGREGVKERRGMTTGTVRGAAGQPRGPPQRRPNSHKSIPHNKRNTNRGIRSGDAIDKRRERRTQKRREARRQKRASQVEEAGDANTIERKERVDGGASAQEPRRAAEKIRYATTLKIATLNVKGMKRMGKREEVEVWMKDNYVQILALQETYIGQNAREARKGYTCFFSGENGRPEYTAGVGIVI